MTSPIEAYVTARQNFVNAASAVRAMANLIATVGNALQHNPRKFAFTNYGTWPMEATMTTGAASVDANSWPTKEHIHERLMDFHQKRDAMNSAWSSVPDQARQGLQPPPPT